MNGARGGGGRVVVIGHGLAASQLVGELAERAPGTLVTVYGEEPRTPYNRVLLADLLAGRCGADAVRLPPAPPGVEVRSGVVVTAIDRAERTVTGSDGSVTRYDVLVLATGSGPVLPPLRGLRDGRGELRPGLFSFRSWADYEQLTAAVPAARRAVVIGGGLLGVTAARALAQRGLPVELVQQAPYLMERYLDRTAAGILHRRLAALGVTGYLECRARSVAAERGTGRVAGVGLAGGYLLDCDLVVLACGTSPRVRLARECGLAVGRGVLVDDTLRCRSDPAVYAIGDCAEHRGRLYGFVEPARQQATALAGVLAARLAGREPAARYQGSAPVVRLTATGIDIAVFGATGTRVPGADVIAAANAAGGSYRKVVIRDRVVLGGILLGQLGAVGPLTRSYQRGEPLTPGSLRLLQGAAAAP